MVGEVLWQHLDDEVKELSWLHAAAATFQADLP